MDRQQLLELYFIDARSKLIDVAAFLDRLDRAGGVVDFRQEAFLKALQELHGTVGRTERVLQALSDPTCEPAERASAKGAMGAFNSSSL